MRYGRSGEGWASRTRSRPTGDFATAMMRDVNSHHSDDPAHRWSALLSGLIGRRRDAVVKALRNSVDSGYPANADGVRVLVAYAQGQISARQYVAQILESLGFVPAAYAPAPAVRAPESWHSARDADPWRAPGRVVCYLRVLARTANGWRQAVGFGNNPHVAKAQAAEEKARSASDIPSRVMAWREAANYWERAADRETIAKRRTEYTNNATTAREEAEGADAPAGDSAAGPAPSSDGKVVPLASRRAK